MTALARFRSAGPDVDLRTDVVSDFVASRFVEQAPAFSPDGRWVAYASDETGRSDVYARRFPGAGRRTRISVEGGSEPAWSRAGGQIFFRSPGGFMAAEVAAGDEVVVRRLARLFDDRPYETSWLHREYAILPGDTALVFIRSAPRGRHFVRLGWAAGAGFTLARLLIRAPRERNPYSSGLLPNRGVSSSDRCWSSPPWATSSVRSTPGLSPANSATS